VAVAVIAGLPLGWEAPRRQPQRSPRTQRQSFPILSNPRLKECRSLVRDICGNLSVNSVPSVAIETSTHA
jgi:hypothetical protein